MSKTFVRVDHPTREVSLPPKPRVFLAFAYLLMILAVVFLASTQDDTDEIRRVSSTQVRKQPPRSPTLRPMEAPRTLHWRPQKRTTERPTAPEVVKYLVSDVARRVAKAWPGNDTWALRIVACETGRTFNPRAVNPNGHYGLFQFALSTWRGVGGRGNPIDASVEEQTHRAWILLNRSGPGQWECRG